MEHGCKLCIGCVERLDGVWLSKTILERFGVALIVKNMIKTQLKWFEQSKWDM